jgi:hypothetical protein
VRGNRLQPVAALGLERRRRARRPGGNDVYLYSVSSGFLHQTYKATNSWVDEVFKLTVP